MPFDLTGELDLAKLSALAALTTPPKIQEVVTIFWAGGTKHYSSTAVDQIADFSAISSYGITGVETRFARNQFLDLPHVSSISDDDVPLDFWDGDDSVTNLYKASGRGTKVVIREYIADVDYLIEVFWGLLKAQDPSTKDRFRIKVSTGFRSPSLPLPRRFIWTGCQALFGGLVRPDTSFLFPTQAAIDDNDCFYNRHIGGGDGLLNGGVPFTSCPRNNQSECTLRLGDTLSYLAFDLSPESEFVVTGDHKFRATTRGNESLQRRPLRVVYGTRVVRELDLLGYESQSVGSNPERGFLKTLFLMCEGEIQDFYDVYVNDQFVGPEHIWRTWGKKRQGKTDFSANILNYSGTAVMRANVGPRDWRGITGAQINGQCTIVGKNDIRVYSSPSTFVKQFTTNRSWCLLDILTNKRYGHQLDHARIVPQDWIDLADWCDDLVFSRDESNNSIQITRSTFNAELNELSAQQQITNICLAGRFTLPFHFNGMTRILPLWTTALGGVPVFKDSGTGRNIIYERGNSTLEWWQKGDEELFNQLKISFDDVSRRFQETTFPYDDLNAQTQAGVAFGDFSVRTISKAYKLLGVTTFAEALRLARMLIDLGEFDQGGLRNNLRCRFVTWAPLADALKLHPWKVIKITNPKLNSYEEQAGEPFEYFRIMKMTRRADQKMVIEAQAYPEIYYNTSDAAFTAGGSGFISNPGGRRIGRPRAPIIRDPVRTLDMIEVTISMT